MSREAAAEVTQLSFDLPAEGSSLAAEPRRPSPIDKILTAVEKKQPGLLWVLAHPLRHIECRREPSSPRRRPSQAPEKLGLERRGRPQPDVGEEDVPRREPVIDRAGGCVHGPGDSTDGRGPGAAGRDEAASRPHDLIRVVLRRSWHAIRILILNKLVSRRAGIRPGAQGHQTPCANSPEGRATQSLPPTVESTEAFRPAWGLLFLRETFDASSARDVHDVYEFHVDDSVISVIVDDGEVQVIEGQSGRPVDVTIHVDATTFGPTAMNSFRIHFGVLVSAL